MDTKDRLQNETHACPENTRYRVPGNYGLARLVLARLFRRENAGVQDIQNTPDNAQGGGEGLAQRIQMSRRESSNTDLIKAVDEGWRYFWKQRGYSEPPTMDSDTFIFGNEKNRDTTNKQKETERAKGIQKARGEFLKGQGL